MQTGDLRTGNMRTRKVTVIKRGGLDDDKDDRYIESHELSLLSLLVAKHPDRARVFLDKTERRRDVVVTVVENFSLTQ